MDVQNDLGLLGLEDTFSLVFVYVESKNFILVTLDITTKAIQ